MSRRGRGKHWWVHQGPGLGVGMDLCANRGAGPQGPARTPAVGSGLQGAMSASLEQGDSQNPSDSFFLGKENKS